MAGSSLVTDDVVTRLRAAGCVFAEEEAALLREAADGAALEPLLARRLAGEPLEHVLGWAELAGVRVAVGPGVFVPRQRSRVLVETVLDLLPEEVSGVVVEVCCGAAAVAAVVARARPRLEVWASDVDPTAVATARRNLAPDRVLRGDLLDGLPGALRGRVDVVVANAPYVPTGELDLMPVEAREHEPVHALDGGPDGVDLHRRIAAEVGPWLRESGAVVVETSRRQAAATAAAFAVHGFATRRRHDPEIDGTAVVATRSAAATSTSRDA